MQAQELPVGHGGERRRSLEGDGGRTGANAAKSRKGERKAHHRDDITHCGLVLAYKGSAVWRGVGSPFSSGSHRP